MKALAKVHLGVVGLESLVEASFTSDQLPALESVEMTISSQLGVEKMACLPNISETLGLQVSIGMPVELSGRSAGPHRILGKCPSTCAIGTFYDRSQICLPCSKGFFSPGVGAARCSPCPPATYMAERGAASCTSCPRFSSSSVNSTDVSDCRCIANYQLIDTPRESFECKLRASTVSSPSPSIPAILLDPGSVTYVVRMILFWPYSPAEFDVDKQVDFLPADCKDSPVSRHSRASPLLSWPRRIY